ncbi:MAG: sugar phosphate nucleotidyltransferase [Acidobacteriota bacterium]
MKLEVQSERYGIDSTQPWAIVLAGGEGERLKPAVCRWLGAHCPKQYCTFLGNRSMLEHTWDRCRQLTTPDHVISIIGTGHRQFLDRLRAPDIPGTVIEQPIAKGTLLAACRPDRLVLLGAVPDGPESDYGWIESESAAAGTTRVHRIKTFSEKPSGRKARQMFKNGGFWNTLVFAAKARLIWDLVEELHPESARTFDLLRRVIRAVRMGRVAPSMEQVALRHIYDSLDEADLSRDLLQRVPRRLLLLPLEDVEWSDWGRPSRIDESLTRHGKAPIFSRPPEEPAAVGRPFGVPIGQPVIG